jgi:hypothetical protein
VQQSQELWNRDEFLGKNMKNSKKQINAKNDITGI